jgi:hypothetical protein
MFCGSPERSEWFHAWVSLYRPLPAVLEKQRALHAQYLEYPQRFVRGQPLAAMPPKCVAINPISPELYGTVADLLNFRTLTAAGAVSWHVPWRGTIAWYKHNNGAKRVLDLLPTSSGLPLATLRLMLKAKDLNHSFHILCSRMTEAERKRVNDWQRRINAIPGSGSALEGVTARATTTFEVISEVRQ